MKIALVQIYRFSPEARLIRRMALEFLRHGYQLVLWSNLDQGSIGLDTIPLLSRERDESLLILPHFNAREWRLYGEWISLHERLRLHYGDVSPNYEPTRCYRASKAVFDSVQPDLFMCWAGLDPWFRIPRELADELQIPTIVWEAGMIPDTLLLDKGGVCCESALCNQPVPTVSDAWVQRAESFLKDWRAGFNGSIRQPPSEIPGKARLPRLLVLGSMDIACGVHRSASIVPTTLPGFKSGIDLAIKLSAFNSGSIVYRPHPNEPAGAFVQFEGSNVIFDCQSHLVSAIRIADVVVGYGSKTDYLAMALGKPFIMAGVGMVSGKGCCYEALTPDDLAIAIQTALQNGQTETQKAAFTQFVAWLLENGCYNRQVSGPCRLGISDLVERAISLTATDPVPILPQPSNNVLAALSSSGQDWLKRENREWRFRRIIAPEPTALATIHRCMNQRVTSAVLDFDHTLLLGNSTELFLATARPRILAEAAEKIGKFCSRFSSPNRIDRHRVQAVMTLLPWSLNHWRRQAAATVSIRWNRALWETVREHPGSAIRIVSHGFRPLIEPLVNAALTSTDRTPSLICSELGPAGRDMRKEGKVAALAAECPEIDWSSSFCVTDSLEDRELLQKCRHRLLTTWPEPVLERSPGYIPFRYIASGKYPGGGYFREYILGQDLVVTLLLVTGSISDVLPALLLFVSFHSVYEIGYYENDFLGATHEHSPTLSGNHLRFQGYPINASGWIFAITTGIAACAMISTTSLPVLLAAWLTTLVLTRVCFGIYNRRPPKDRIPYYLLLQGLKNFAYLAVMPVTLVGAAAAISQFVQHSTVYSIYRCGGDKNQFPRELVRALLFFAGIAFLCITGHRSDLSLFQVLLGSFWIGYHMQRGRLKLRQRLSNFLRKVRGFAKSGIKPQVMDT